MCLLHLGGIHHWETPVWGIDPPPERVPTPTPATSLTHGNAPSHMTDPCPVTTADTACYPGIDLACGVVPHPVRVFLRPTGGVGTGLKNEMGLGVEHRHHQHLVGRFKNIHKYTVSGNLWEICWSLWNCKGWPHVSVRDDLKTSTQAPLPCCMKLWITSTGENDLILHAVTVTCPHNRKLTACAQSWHPYELRFLIHPCIKLKETAINSPCETNLD